MLPGAEGAYCTVATPGTTTSGGGAGSWMPMSTCTCAAAGAAKASTRSAERTQRIDNPLLLNWRGLERLQNRARQTRQVGIARAHDEHRVTRLGLAHDPLARGLVVAGVPAVERGRQ